MECRYSSSEHSTGRRVRQNLLIQYLGLQKPNTGERTPSWQGDFWRKRHTPTAVWRSCRVARHLHEQWVILCLCSYKLYTSFQITDYSISEESLYVPLWDKIIPMYSIHTELNALQYTQINIFQRFTKYVFYV